MNIKDNGGSEHDKQIFDELAYSQTDAGRKKLIQKFNRSTRPQQIKDYFQKSIIPQQDQWAVYGMRGQKDGLFTCQPSESFHNTMYRNNIRFTPMVFIPENSLIGNIPESLNYERNIKSY